MAAKKKSPVPGSAAWQKKMRQEYESLLNIDERYAAYIDQAVRRVHLDMLNDDARYAGEPLLKDTFDYRYESMSFPDSVAFIESNADDLQRSWYAPIVAFCKKYPNEPEAHHLADQFNAFQKAMEDVPRWASKYAPFGL